MPSIGRRRRALTEAFRAFGADASLKVAILSGSGEHFCAGADLSEAKKLALEIAAMPQICMRGDRLSACEQWA